MTSSFKEYIWETFDRMCPDQMTLYEMTCLSPKDTGLEHHIWMSSRGNTKHGPRVKISNVPGKFDSEDSFSMSVDHEPVHRAGKVKLKSEHVEKIKDWIKLNHDHLQQAWKSDTMDSRDHIDGVKKL
jgi:hypothetical protein